MSKIEVDTIDTQSSTTLQVGSTNTALIKIGTSGDTVEYPAGTTFTQSGTQNVTAGGAINVKSGGSIIIDSGAAITNNGTATGFSADLTNLNATNLTSGTVPNARFPATLPIANGSALTNLNATNLGSGTVPDARFPATLPAISGANLTNLPGGGGKILQVVEAATTTAATTTSTSYVTTGLEVAITPSATTSKILVFATWVTGFVQSDKDCRFQLFRDSTSVGGGADADRYIGVGGGAQTADTWFNYGFQQFNIQKLDSPSSTSALTYKIMFNVNSGSGATGHFGEQRAGDNAGNNVICAMEIGA